MTPELQFTALLQRFDRVAIAGGPRTGKTTLSELARSTHEVIGTDAYQQMEWSEIPHRMLADLEGKKRFVVEGVMVARMLRKAAQLGQPPPVDVVIWREGPKVQQSPGQAAMTKGIRKVFFQDWYLAHRDDVPVFGL